MKTDKTKLIAIISTTLLILLFLYIFIIQPQLNKYIKQQQDFVVEQTISSIYFNAKTNGIWTLEINNETLVCQIYPGQE